MMNMVKPPRMLITTLDLRQKTEKQLVLIATTSLTDKSGPPEHTPCSSVMQRMLTRLIASGKLSFREANAPFLTLQRSLQKL